MDVPSSNDSCTDDYITIESPPGTELSKYAFVVKIYLNILITINFRIIDLQYCINNMGIIINLKLKQTYP